MSIALFIAEPIGRCRVVLRRFRFSDGDDHGHSASVVIDENAPVTPREPDGTVPVTDYRIPHDDPRWPAACACGEPFAETDQWQVNEQDWYEGGGQRFAWGIGSWDGPPGAMIRAPWRDDPDRMPAWTVFLPNGTYWNTNDRAKVEGPQLGPYWQVDGTVPRITVSPSIDDRSPTRPWHGFIRDGQLDPA